MFHARCTMWYPGIPCLCKGLDDARWPCIILAVCKMQISALQAICFFLILFQTLIFHSISLSSWMSHQYSTSYSNKRVIFWNWLLSTVWHYCLSLFSTKIRIPNVQAPCLLGPSIPTVHGLILFFPILRARIGYLVQTCNRNLPETVAFILRHKIHDSHTISIRRIQSPSRRRQYLLDTVVLNMFLPTHFRCFRMSKAHQSSSRISFQVKKPMPDPR